MSSSVLRRVLPPFLLPPFLSQAAPILVPGTNHLFVCYSLSLIYVPQLTCHFVTDKSDNPFVTVITVTRTQLTFVNSSLNSAQHRLSESSPSMAHSSPATAHLFPSTTLSELLEKREQGERSLSGILPVNEMPRG